MCNLKSIATIEAKVPCEFVYNKMISQGVLVMHPQNSSNGVTFSVEKRRAKEAVKALNSAGVHAEIKYSNGLSLFFKSITKNIGIILGFAVGIVLIALYSCCIFNIEVVCDSKEVKADVEEKLNSLQIATPMAKNKIDLVELEKNIDAMPNISDVSIEVNGVNLVVNVLQKLPKVAVKDTQNPISIVSDYDGKIINIFATRGTALVKVGDEVKAGDVLIAPYYLDAEGKQIAVCAEGKIELETVISKIIIYPDTYIKDARTGEKEVITTLNVCGLKGKSKSHFEKYESESKSTIIANVVPLEIVQTTYFELAPKEIEFDFDGMQEVLVDNAYKDVENTLPSNAQIAEKWFLIKRLDKMTELSIYYKLRLDLGS